MSEELSSRLVGYGLPKVAQELIHDIVHKTGRVYRDYRASYRIALDENDMVIVHVAVSYKVVNNGSGSERYSPWLQEEGAYDPQLVSLEYGGRHENPLVSRDANTRVASWIPERKVSITPSSATDAIDSLPAEKVCPVHWQYTLKMPQKYSAVVSFGGVTVNPTIEHTDLPPNFEFHASQEEEYKCTHANGGSIWEYKRAFLSGQHIRVRWGPRF